MRAFELILASICIVMILQDLFVERRKIDKDLLALLLSLILALHIVMEGSRWQITGVYIVVLYEVVLTLKGYLFNKRDKDKNLRTKRNIKISWFFLIVVMVTLFLALLFPVSKLPEPKGNYDVGTMTFDMTDTERLELYGDHKGDLRKIRVQMYYPSEATENLEVVKWNEDGLVVPRGVQKSFGLPLFLMDHTTLIDSNSYKDLPLASNIKQMPVVIISHGWTGFRNLHADWCEMLASYGYLAITIDHTYGSVGLTFENGEEVYVDLYALPSRESNDDFDLYATQLVDTFSKDSQLVLNFVEELNTGNISIENLDFGDAYIKNHQDMFINHLDTHDIGVIGHSTGGGGMVKLALSDERVTCLIGMDPWVEPIGENMLSEGLNVASMFFRSSKWAGGINDEYIQILTEDETKAPVIYEIQGSKHIDFTAMYLYGPITKINGLQGELDGYESALIQQDFILQFLDQQLKDQYTGIEQLVNEYDQVEEVFPQ